MTNLFKWFVVETIATQDRYNNHFYCFAALTAEDALMQFREAKPKHKSKIYVYENVLVVDYNGSYWKAKGFPE